MTRQLADTALEHSHDWLSESWLVEVDDVLNDVVSEGVLHQDPSMLGNPLDEPELLLARGMVDATLQDTAAMTVRADFNAVVTNGVKNELRVDGSELIETLLDDVVAIKILDELYDAEAQGLDDEMDLLRSVHILNHLLQGTSAMLIQGNADHILRRVLDQDGSLVIIAVLEELLAQIITKWVRHELDDVLIGLEPDHVDLFGIALLQFLLEVTAAVLIFTQFVDLAAK